jgi:succinyl-diaminopimelate desuccinylase
MQKKVFQEFLLKGKLDHEDFIEIMVDLEIIWCQIMRQRYLEPSRDYQGLFADFLKQKGYEGQGAMKMVKHSLKSVGKSAHGSTPQFGENAIDRLFEFFH